MKTQKTYRLGITWPAREGQRWRRLGRDNYEADRVGHFILRTINHPGHICSEDFWFGENYCGVHNGCSVLTKDTTMIQFYSWTRLFGAERKYNLRVTGFNPNSVNKTVSELKKIANTRDKKVQLTEVLEE